MIHLKENLTATSSTLICICVGKRSESCLAYIGLFNFKDRVSSLNKRICGVWRSMHLCFKKSEIRTSMQKKINNKVGWVFLGEMQRPVLYLQTEMILSNITDSLTLMKNSINKSFHEYKHWESFRESAFQCGPPERTPEILPSKNCQNFSLYVWRKEIKRTKLLLEKCSYEVNTKKDDQQDQQK